MPQIGQLDKRVVIQAPVQTADEYNQPVQTWHTLTMAWARIDPLVGRERYVAAQEISTMTVRITVRYTSKTRVITPEHRVLHNARGINKARIFQIATVRDLRESHEWIQMVCGEVIS